MGTTPLASSIGQRARLPSRLRAWGLAALTDIRRVQQGIVKTVREVRDGDGERQFDDLVVIEILLQLIERRRPYCGGAACHALGVKNHRLLLGIEGRAAKEESQRLDLLVGHAVLLSRRRVRAETILASVDERRL